MANHVLATTNIERILMTSSKKIHEFGWLEAKTSGGAVFEQGVKESKRAKAIRTIAQPLMEKHWKDSVVNLHRVYKVAEYLYNRKKRNK